MEKEKEEELLRLRGWILQEMNGGRKTARGVPALQAGCPSIIPHLRSQPIWDTSTFQWVSELEASSHLIKQELLSLKGSKGGAGFQPYRSPSWSANTTANDGTIKFAAYLHIKQLIYA